MTEKWAELCSMVETSQEDEKSLKQDREIKILFSEVHVEIK